ncbi:hypothetical protein HNP81_001567 [Peribacillus huizhouensis]|uniref:Uncharacterized protein n=1 Tax=Peribacillus huizhouensis TaxID=1501239 RepID=A0ABR6CML7_9BACI|nr:hypothetical protein [Peribacillus huizhouensis]
MISKRIMKKTTFPITLWPDLLLSTIHLPYFQFAKKVPNNFSSIAIFNKAIRFFGPLPKGVNHEKRCHIHLFR